MTRRITVDATRLRQAPPEMVDGREVPIGMLIYPGSHCGCVIGITLAACGVPLEELAGESWYQGESWPDFLPVEWRDGWVMGEGPDFLSGVADLFDKGFEREAGFALVEGFAAQGVELVFEPALIPEEIVVFSAVADRDIEGRAA